jgi:hypothetical protein
MMRLRGPDIDNGEKIELMGHHLFGDKWQGREVGKKEEREEPKKEPGQKAAAPVSQPAAEPAGTPNDGKPVDQEIRETADGEADATRTAAVKEAVKEAGEEKGKEALERGAVADERVRAAMVPEGTKPKKADTQEGVTTATTPVTGMPPKQTPPARELSRYEKALLEGKTHLEAMYAQAAPEPKVQGGVQPEALSPKANPLDAFSEPVKTARSTGSSCREALGL